MKFSSFIISIPLVLIAASCHQGSGEEGGAPSGKENSMSGNTLEISVSREQFESMNMLVGDPAPEMFSNSVEANGYIEAAPQGCAKISAMIPGRVSQINISSGDFIKRGQTLFTIEGQEIIRLQQDYAEAFHRLKLLKSDYERMQLLSGERIAAEKDFLKAESEYKSVQAEVEGLKVTMRMVDIDPSLVERGTIVPFLAVKSPISGSVTQLRLVLGQQLEPLETAVEVVDHDQLRLKLEVFETSIADLAVGQHVKFATPNLPERKYSAALSHIGKSVSSDSRTIECFAVLDADKRNLFVNNMYVESSIIIWEREALAVPEQAVIRDHDRDYVLVLSAEQEDQFIFRQIPVQTGATYQGYTEILDENLSGVLLEGAFSIRIEE